MENLNEEHFRELTEEEIADKVNWPQLQSIRIETYFDHKEDLTKRDAKKYRVFIKHEKNSTEIFKAIISFWKEDQMFLATDPKSDRHMYDGDTVQQVVKGLL